MRDFDRAATNSFFNTAFSAEQEARVSSGVAPRLHARDRILIERILPAGRKEAQKILDFGCGQGRLLSWLLENGYDATGIEPNAGMLRVAKKEIEKFGTSRLIHGSLDALAPMKDETYDTVVIMGVLQYLPDDEYAALLNEAKRVLKGQGVLVCTFQNALFDLFTFNKYTVDFLINELLFPAKSTATSVEKRSEIARDIERLITNPDKPAYASARARDNVFVRLSNPLLIEQHLSGFGLRMIKKYFYEYFGLPPLISPKHQEVAQVLGAQFEVGNAEAWQGTFMANAFLIEATKS